MPIKVTKWVLLPALLIGSIFSRSAARHELLLDIVVCLGALLVVQRAVRLKAYLWAAGFVTIAVVFSPFLLVIKIFLLMGFAGLATFVTFLTAWKTTAMPAAGLLVALLAAMPGTAFGQTSDSLDTTGKLRFHARSTYVPLSIVGVAAYAAVLQADGAPKEWGGGAAAYGKRFASTMAWSGIHSTLAFSLDSTLHQDPRYFRSGGTGFWRRPGHALRGTILTRTDSGAETLSTWRIGSAYGAAYLSNQWYPDRLNTARLDVIQGSVTLGFDLDSNLGSEFWPDLKNRVFRRD